jgi:hypothetical protein
MEMLFKRTLLFGGMSLALVVVMGQSQNQGIIVGSHDEPIVIDNGPPVVFRRISIHEPGPHKESGKDSWHIHHTNDLVLLKASVNTGGGFGTPLELSLSSIDRVGFQLVDSNGNEEKLAISTKDLRKKLRLHASKELELSASTYLDWILYRFASPNFDRFRIRHVTTYDDADGRNLRHTICLRDARAPHTGACDPNPTNYDVRVVICPKPDRNEPLRCPNPADWDAQR